MLISYSAAAQNLKANDISWSKVAALPVSGPDKALGIAGPFAGVSNSVLLIAGGANFPGAKPWEGGKKVDKDDIYALERISPDKFRWVTVKNRHLPQHLAYGASVTTSKGVVCIGGETNDASCSKTAFIMEWDAMDGRVDFHDLPPLPVPVVNACAANIGLKVYLFGGECNSLPTGASFEIDLSADHPAWKSLPPLPIPMSHSVAVAQSNGHYPCLYVVGGRSATPEGISDLHKCTFCFDPDRSEWTRMSDIGDGKQTTHMSAATAIAYGTNQVILIGGDKGDIFHRIETCNAAILKANGIKQKQALTDEKLKLVTHHPGFSRDVYIYDTLTDQWRKISELPFYGQVTTVAVKWDNDIIIPCGEIMPGTRTPEIVCGRTNK